MVITVPAALHRADLELDASTRHSSPSTTCLVLSADTAT